MMKRFPITQQTLNALARKGFPLTACFLAMEDGWLVESEFTIFIVQGNTSLDSHKGFIGDLMYCVGLDHNAL